MSGKHREPRGWIDVTMPVISGMVHWPGDRAIAVEKKLPRSWLTAEYRR